ncbi:Hypothetical predicted protein [Pelobates cultripes]|uniref:Uncharacterized protein n=1 Tax=Pelobates cultripes TaxID=61616 RepID=A0AAD1SZM3_PELCU|nr:Hypothetical predicted protein [Pelobates cultripes]
MRRKEHRNGVARNDLTRHQADSCRRTLRHYDPAHPQASNPHKLQEAPVPLYTPEQDNGEEQPAVPKSKASPQTSSEEIRPANTA